MPCESLRGVLLACLLAAGCAFPAPVPSLVAQLKAARDTAQWTAALKGLGLPEDSLQALDYRFASGIRMARAETFYEDLDSDGRKEGITQVLFETPPEYGKSGVEYLILIHADPKGKPALRYHRRFALMKCGYVKGSGMRFSFPKAPKGQGRKVLFAITDVRTCDPGGQEFSTRVDTLAWKGPAADYRPDANPRTADRKGDPEGP